MSQTPNPPSPGRTATNGLSVWRPAFAPRCLAAALLIAGSLLLAGCGDSTTPGASTTDSSVAQAASPEELADAIVETWSQSMQDLVALLEDRPDVSATVDQVEQLKESYIQQLVALGEQRETLSAADRATVDSLEMNAMFDLGSSDWYQSFQDIWSHYSDEDLDFANLVASFNTLAQYSDFGLLAEQLPDEAIRLGVQPSSDSTQD